MAEQDLKNLHVAVYALSLLGGGQKKVHTEHIARKCLEIAPDRFKWEHYDYPEKELVRKALFHASEKRNGGLVAGRAGMEQRGKSRDGWQLTPAGANWLNEHMLLLRSIVPPKSDVLPKREAERFLKKLRSEGAYQAYLAKGNLDGVSQYVFTDLLNCSPDAPVETVRLKFDRLLTLAKLVGDAGVLKFLESCEIRFSNLLKQSPSEPE